MTINWGYRATMENMEPSTSSTFIEQLKEQRYKYKQQTKTELTAELNEKIAILNKKINHLEKIDNQRYFYTTIIFSISALIIGSLVSLPALGSGLMLGGIITAAISYYGYWNYLSETMKFFLLLLAFIIIIVSGSCANRFSKRKILNN